ncbi:MAG: hypothetical protein KJO31_12010 [Gammaproteobacteria bacterium]|nr:hypothetical protein [Gammaproteobacteria bacterium]
MIDQPSPDENILPADETDDSAVRYADFMNFAIDVDHEERADKFDTVARRKKQPLSARQRVEMLQEEQWLQTLITDLENLDFFESTNDRFFEGLSH